MNEPVYDCLSRWLGKRCEPPQVSRAWPRTRYEKIHITIANTAAISIFVSALFGAITTFIPFERESMMKLQVVEGTSVGGTLRVKVDYCVGRSPLTKLSVSLRNDITVILSDEILQLPEGCRTTMVTYPLSPEIPAGTYRLGVYGVVEPWPWRSTPYSFESPPFKISAVPSVQ